MKRNQPPRHQPARTCREREAHTPDPRHQPPVHARHQETPLPPGPSTHQSPTHACINEGSAPPCSVHPPNTNRPAPPPPRTRRTTTTTISSQQAMEAEAFPIRFTQGVRAYWRRRKYHRLAEGADGTKPRSRSRQLGSASGVGGARLRRRVRVLLAGPRRALARARDAYVGGMLSLAKRASALALPGAVEALWTKRVPRRKQGQLPAAPAGSGKPTEFEQRLIFEIYKSIVASKELSTMLHASAPQPATLAAGIPSTHLLDM
ncbi:hypothetical protein BDA96_09G256100 [Sorghum bicolor]|uniref:Uncharacterized protein n=1 Tax=Sorghum bicolor TaxID=4558 RepID=A0A921U5S7_SORBI|nr:hypothetical protein BDA96_09G256100 [Sorghum bicolor]